MQAPHDVQFRLELRFTALPRGFGLLEGGDVDERRDDAVNVAAAGGAIRAEPDDE